jgi:hypothetical protein
MPAGDTSSSDLISILRSRAPRIALGIAAGQAVWPSVQWAKKRLKSHREFTVKVPNDCSDDLYNELHEWVLSLLPPGQQKALVAYAASRQRMYIPDLDDDDDGYRSRRRKTQSRLRLRYDGSRDQHVSIRDHKIKVSVSDGNPAGNGKSYQPPEIVFTASHISARDAVLEEINTILLAKQEKSHTPVFRMLNQYDEWERIDDLPGRSLGSVILPSGQLQRLTGDISKFLADEEAYGRRSVPWHRGYLFEGPPGTGKTSAARALACHFSLDMWYLPLSGVKKDTDLIKIVLGVKGRSVLLLEDIDIFHGATNRNDNTGTATLSGLLNALDGIVTPHGLITIMTTNEPEMLDPALVRAGRIDLTEHFGLSGPDEVARLIAWWYDVPVTAELVEQLPSSVELAPADVAEICKQHKTEQEAVAALKQPTRRC